MIFYTNLSFINIQELAQWCLDHEVDVSFGMLVYDRIVGGRADNTAYAKEVDCQQAAAGTIKHCINGNMETRIIGPLSINVNDRDLMLFQLRFSGLVELHKQLDQ